jgi:hypothetical protein
MVETLVAKNDELLKQIERQNEELLALQQENMSLSSTKEELQRKSVMLEGNLEIQKKEMEMLEPNSTTPLTPEQDAFVKERASALTTLEHKVRSVVEKSSWVQVR